jgi:hypothetical protein
MGMRVMPFLESTLTTKGRFPVMKKLFAAFMTLAFAVTLGLGSVGCSKDKTPAKDVKDTVKDTVKETAKDTVKDTAKETVTKDKDKK